MPPFTNNTNAGTGANNRIACVSHLWLRIAGIAILAFGVVTLALNLTMGADCPVPYVGSTPFFGAVISLAGFFTVLASKQSA